MLLKGAPVARAIADALRGESDTLRTQGVTPCLATVRVGEKDADLAYERGIAKRCEQSGVTVQRIAFPADLSQETLLRELSALGRTPASTASCCCARWRSGLTTRRSAPPSRRARTPTA